MTRIAAFLTLALLALPAQAAQPGADCESLAERAGAEAGVPAGLMTAIARTEAGRGIGGGKVRAWPWTLNQGGKGSYHADHETALAAAQAVIDSGVRNLDLGCMQLNWRWHGQAFRDAAEMLDPAANTRYAAMFLAELARRNGSWARAVELYHSADPDRGPTYARKVSRALDALIAEGGAPPDAAASAETLLAAAAPAQVDANPDPMTLSDPEMVRSEAAARVAGLLALPQGPIVARSGPADLREARAPGFGIGPLSRAAQRK